MPQALAPQPQPALLFDLDGGEKDNTQRQNQQCVEKRYRHGSLHRLKWWKIGEGELRGSVIEQVLRDLDVYVMLAFGHSRIRDFILGGATKAVLADLRRPALLSH